jgi:hypothetical protein
MGSASPAVSVRGNRTRAPEEKGVRGFCWHVEWPHVAGAVIKAQNDSFPRASHERVSGDYESKNRPFILYCPRRGIRNVAGSPVQLVRLDEDGWGHSETEGLGRLEVDHEPAGGKRPSTVPARANTVSAQRPSCRPSRARLAIAILIQHPECRQRGYQKKYGESPLHE